MDRTDLFDAASDGNVEEVKKLLEKGADPNAQDGYGDTPLHKAASGGRVDVVKLLLERGADPNIQDKDGNTPLHKAAYNGHVRVVKLLLERGADPNIKDKYGDTLLHWAASRGRVDVVKLLLEHGADPTVKNKYRRTPLDLAREEGYHGIVSLIEERLRRGKRPPQRRKTAEPRPPGGSQKAASPPLSTAQPPPSPHGALAASSSLLADVELVDRLAGELIAYSPVSPSGSFFDVPELGLSGCVFFRCGAYFCIYRCVLNGAQVAVKVPVQYRVDFERGAPPHPTEAPPAVLKELETVKALSHRNVLRLVHAWPRHGVLAYEWGDGGVAERSKAFWRRRLEGACPRGLGSALPPFARGGARRLEA